MILRGSGVALVLPDILEVEGFLKYTAAQTKMFSLDFVQVLMSICLSLLSEPRWAVIPRILYKS